MKKNSIHNPRYQTRISNVVTDAVIIRHDDWKRIRRAAVHLTPEEHAAIRARQEETRQKTMSEIQTKRATQITPELSPDTVTRTHFILGRTEERDHAVRIAEQKADEDLDEVKHVKSQMVSAEARTIRDGQLVELAAIREVNREAERRWADELEKNRVEALHFYEDRENSLREQRRAGRKIISTQIEEHKINAILEAERRDREAKALKEQNAKIAEENQRIWEDRKRRQQAFLNDCLTDEAARKERRRREREFEKEEIGMVMEVAAQRALAEAAVEQERADTRALKEREINAIRKKQQRAMDGQAIRDEEMAIKIQKEKDDLAREKELREREARWNLMKECTTDRKMMIEAKKERLQREAEEDAEQVRKVFEANRLARERARKQWEEKVKVDGHYREELGEAADREWLAKQPDLAKKARERKQITDANDEYLARVNRLRDEKLAILRKKGVPEKYLVDIKADRFELR
jgi:hypothetical protein